MGFSSAAWSKKAIVVIMFKSSYGFSVRMIFAFVFIIIIPFPSEIQTCCKSTAGLHLPSAASGLWRQQGSPRGGGWVPPCALVFPLEAKGCLPSTALPEQPSPVLEACKFPAKILRLEEC